MKKAFVCCSLFFFSLCFAQQNLTLEQVLAIAIENNYDLNKQKYALAQAQAELRQTMGSLDFEVGAEAKYSLKNNPVDEQDPNYAYGYSFYNKESLTDIYSNNTIARQSSGSVYIKKLFDFGLESKLSYTIQRNHNTPEYRYSHAFDQEKYKQELGRNLGDINLELSLPLFKSFKNSITALKIESAQNYIEQMRMSLEDALSQMIIDVSKLYWEYYLASFNLQQFEALQNKLDKRLKNTRELQAAGMRSKNNLLTIQANSLDNKRQIESARIKKADAKFKLLQAMGTDDELGDPNFDFVKPDFENKNFPTAQNVNSAFIERVLSSRNDLIVLKKKVEVAKGKVDLAKIQARPDANLNFNVGTTGAKYSDSIIDVADSGLWNIRGLNFGGSVGVTMKLGNNEKKGAQDSSIAEYNMAVNEYNKAKNGLTTQIKNAVENMAAYRKNVENADEVLELQNSVYKNQEDLFNSGFISADDLIDQDQKFINANTTYYQTLIDYMQGVLQFKYLTGEMLKLETPAVEPEHKYPLPATE